MSLSLRSISDQEILSRTKALTVQERKLTLNLLLHLNEIERRKLHLKRGHATLFAYCTAGLGYSAGAAMRRIQAARCIAQFPEIRGLLASTQVNLSTIGLVSGILNAANKDELLKRICGKSQREVEAIAAEHAPKAAVPRDKVRTIVVRVPVAAPAADNFRNGNNAALEARSSATESRAEIPPTGVLTDAANFHNGNDHAVKPAGDRDELPATGKLLAGAAVLERRAVIQFSARDTVIRKLEQVRALASHRLPANAPMEQLIEFLADDFIKRQDPAARHERRVARKQEPTPKAKPTTSSARAIPARVRDEVFVRGNGECGYVGPDGKRCGSKHVLQLDHIKPVAQGGASTIDNLRLLCAHHNRLEAERLIGESGPPRRT